MFKINLGRWQLACSKEVMVNSWLTVRRSKLTLSESLKKQWKLMKQFLHSLSKSYKEYKYKLILGKQVFVLKFKEENYDEIVDSCIEKIAEIKGKKFVYKISNKLYQNYDALIKKFEDKGSLTFCKNVFVLKLK